jgi:demethylmenaquinone methyltransferase/2-methoxy-6-polyprenyl-1,4-benzoquinol methylase
MQDEKTIVEGDRSWQIRHMFGQIAHRYDLMNSIISLRLHHRWRRLAVSYANPQPGEAVLDVCSGTGDLAIALAQAVGRHGQVIGIDFCLPMLELARRKASLKHSICNVYLALGDALSLPLPSDHFACATVGWGIRNVPDINAAFREMTRVVRPGGRVVCLDMAKPKFKPMSLAYGFYFYKILPLLGGLFSRKEAYSYLPNSVTNFPDREELAERMRDAGLTDIHVVDLAWGAVCIHWGVKPCPTQPA